MHSFRHCLMNSQLFSVNLWPKNFQKLLGNHHFSRDPYFVLYFAHFDFLKYRLIAFFLTTIDLLTTNFQFLNICLAQIITIVFLLLMHHYCFGLIHWLLRRNSFTRVRKGHYTYSRNFNGHQRDLNIL